jgi:hypothetical protein
MCCAFSVSEQYAFRYSNLQQAKNGIVEDDDDGSLERSNNSSEMVPLLAKSYFQSNPKATLYCSKGIHNNVLFR